MKITENLYIIGDADEKLQLLDDDFIKLIYIDPPYNTGAKFVYHDKRHKNEWLQFMRSKLVASKRVLKENGVIFISIDDNEYDTLIQLCNEIFGTDNRLGTLITRQATRSNAKHINTIHEYVVCYAKNKKKVERFETLRTNIPTYKAAISRLTKDVKATCIEHGQQKATEHLQQLLKHYEHIDGFAWLKNYNMVDSKGNIFFAKDLSAPGEPNSLDIPEIPLTLEPLKTRRWSSKEKFLHLHKEDKLVYKNGRPYRKSLLVESKDALMSMLNFYSRQGTHDLEHLGLKDIFDTPKPVDMIKLFILSTCKDGDVVLDFFSGSATTGQAVCEVNKETGQNILCVLMQIPEPIAKTSKIGKLLIENGYESNLSNIGLLRLEWVHKHIKNCSFKVIT